MYATTAFLAPILALISLAVANATPDSAIQHPFSHPEPLAHDFKDRGDWRFNYSSAAPHYFSSIHGLLQQWPSTFFPNGHTIAAGTIPPFTTLYHGRRDAATPPSPEWLAFDAGMAYGIMGSTQESFLLTYQTTRAVRVVYFDGESAALMSEGRMDAQMLHIYGNVSGPPDAGKGFRGLVDEYLRSTGLCNWLREKKLGGPGWGFEGIVRMNAGFELIWCDFTSPSMKLVSQLNVSAPLLPSKTGVARDLEGTLATESYFPLPHPPTNTKKAESPPNPAMPPNWRIDETREPFLASQAWGWFTSAASHYGSSGLGSRLGETRVKLTHCGILSYYSPEFKSLALARAQDEQRSLNLTHNGLWSGPRDKADRNDGRQAALDQLTRRRRAHTLNGTSGSDASNMRATSERVLADIVNGNQTSCSGMDWTAITMLIVQRYASDLIDMRDLLRAGNLLPPTNRTSVQNWIAELRENTHALLVPFLEYPPNGKVEKVWDGQSTLSQETFSRCKYHYTRLLVPEEGILLGPEEQLLKWAVEETMHGICSVIVTIGLATERIWAREFNEVREPEPGDWQAGKHLLKERGYWTAGVEELMAWLGWAGEWARCEEVCAWDEACFIPMWPLVDMFPAGGGPGRGHDGPHGRPDGPDDGRGPPEGGGSGPGEDPPRRRPRKPVSVIIDDTHLWQPKCVKSDYLMHRLFERSDRL